MRRAARKDTTHNPICDALRAVGYSVADTSRLGAGFPDAVVGGIDRRTGRPANWLIEFKTGQGKLTTDEAEFHAAWRGTVHVVRTVAEALALVGVEQP